MTDIRQSLPDKVRHISVNIHDREIGTLTHGSQYTFAYTRERPEISLTMPYRAEPYQRGAIHPIFTQNLPEGYVRRFIAEKLARYATVDDMYLLGLMGNRGVGLLGFDASIVLPEPDELSLNEIIHWNGKETLFPTLLERFYLGGMASGVQPKILVNASLPLTRGAVPHANLIVKSFDVEFPLLTVNEFICMGAAKHCGLNPPNIWLSDNLENYIIERFDIDSNGLKLGIEDFATLMGKTGDDKYQSSYESVLKVVQNNTQSPIEVERTFKLVVFNCLIGNGDAHLKNFSLQYDVNQTTITLAPPYDITHTLIYDTIDNNMALKMRNSKAFPNKKELITFAHGGGIQISKAKIIIEEMAQNIIDFINQSAEVDMFIGLKDSILKHVKSTMTTPAIRAAYSHVKKRKYE